ncbi:AraC family transcriptional regulator [Paenibacillus sambharensis]|uniref:AraC family transcriptional regulator n=1 Tax=Paenibacillus sambharensis TaxID=1803190 RepID=A0A2W1LQW8_9BACL|nr:AraC family transcriptional regulator [Paenibacillus sambharensis]PZD97352.1 AraC family transcriptional regulator [Paenibacillus sambharensis]
MTCVKVNVDRPVHFLAAGEFFSDTGWTHSSRTMNNYELIIGVEGTVYMEEGGERFEVGPGDILMLMPGRVHGGYQPSKPGVRFYWLHMEFESGAVLIDEEELKQDMEGINGHANRAWSVRELYVPQFMKDGLQDRMSVIIKQILHVANAGYYTYQSVNYLLTSLLIEVSETLLGRVTRRGDLKGDVHFSKIAEWTRIHATEAITVADIAARFNYNRDYLTRLFKQHIGKGPLDYIQTVRIEKAKELLSRTSHTVKEIAAMCGFQDDKYFMRLFRLQVNMTPSQFRNAYHKTFMNND